MKTVIDAVNEFKCKWPFDTYFMCTTVKKNTDFEEGTFRESRMVDVNHMHTHLCSREEFNQCVDEMATNYGTSETYSDYKVNYEMINDDMKPVTEDKIICYVCHVGAFPMQQYCGSCGHELLSELIPVTVPKFTETMSEDKKLPPIGSEYLDEDGQLCKALLHHGSFVLGEMLEHAPMQQYPVFSTSRNDRVSRVTPPIELIDGERYEFEHSSIGVALGFYLKDKELFDCAGTYYSIESGCTNIQLLEVKS